MKYHLRQSIIHFAQGLLMGGADIIPGVSGGTMALIVGIYSRLIAGLSEVFSAFPAFAKLDFRAGKEHLRAAEWGLLIPLGGGIVAALLVGARFIPILLEAYPHECLGLFFGLVAGSIAIPWHRIDRKGGRHFVIAPVAAVIAYFLTGFPPGEGFEPSLLQVFGSAAVAICAMILPGISGAFLLKAMGMYEVTLMAVNARDFAYIVVFGCGAVVGLGLFSRLLDWLLNYRYNVTMAALVGLMTGALRALWPWQDLDRSLRFPTAGEPVWMVLILGAIGFLFVASLAWWGHRLEKRREEPALTSQPQLRSTSEERP